MAFAPEQKLKLTSKNKGMSDFKVKEFIMYYERITRQMMKDFSKISDITVFLDKHRSTKMRFLKNEIFIKYIFFIFGIILQMQTII